MERRAYMKANIKRAALMSLAVVLAAIIGILAFCAFKREKNVTYSADVPNETEKTEDEICNILFLGVDSQAGLCDVMVLVGINFTEGTVTAVQIPRDTYAAYTSADYKKLNGAYTSLGGADKTADFIGDSFGVEIHGYMCINLDTFADIVDAVGGVDINLPCNMYYSDPEQGLYINLKKGYTHLDGNAARQFVRYRSGYANGDLGRIDAQKLFLAAMLEKLVSDFSPALALKISSALDGVETNMEITDAVSFAARALKLKLDSVRIMTLPGKAAVAEISGASYYVLSRASCEELFKAYFDGGEFDGERVFLNTDYKSFEKIYAEYVEYSVYSVSDILENGIDFG